jgi:hypothetical protein
MKICPNCRKNIIACAVCTCVALGTVQPPHHEAVFPDVKLYAAEPPHTPHKDAPELVPNIVVRIATSTISGSGTFHVVPPPG